MRISQKSGGGFETYVTNILNRLARIHPELDVYTLYPEHFPDVPEGRRIKIGRNFKRNAKAPAAAADRKAAVAPAPPRRFGLSGDALRMVWTQVLFPLHLLQGRYDVFFATTHLDALPFSPVKQVVNVQDVTPLVFPQHRHKYRTYIQRVLPTVYRRADHLLAVSENTKKDMIRFYGLPPEKITVIYEAIDHDLFQPPAPGRDLKADLARYRLPEKFLLSVSSNLPHKNLPRMIQAYGQVRKAFDVPLVVIGYLTAEHQKEILEVMGNCGLTDQDVRFLGHFSAADLPAIYAACELFVFVSMYEGFGFPPLEAMACGAPVVVSNVASIPEVVGEAGVYVDPHDAASIAAGIQDLLSDDGRRRDLRRKGLEQAKKFSWEKAAAETLEVLRRVALS